MTDDMRKRIAAALNRPDDFTREQLLLFDCMMSLNRLARNVLFILESGIARRGGKDTSDSEKAEDMRRIVCYAGALSECFMAAFSDLKELLAQKHGRAVSDEEAAAAWCKWFEWCLAKGICAPVWHCDGEKDVPMPVDALYRQVVGVNRDVKAFRRQLHE